MSAIVRNLSWKPDRQGEERLRELGVMTVLCEQVMRAEKEPTLASMLGALWNLTGHSELNRKDFCAIEVRRLSFSFRLFMFLASLCFNFERSQFNSRHSY